MCMKVAFLLFPWACVCFMRRVGDLWSHCKLTKKDTFAYVHIISHASISSQIAPQTWFCSLKHNKVVLRLKIPLYMNAPEWHFYSRWSWMRHGESASIQVHDIFCFKWKFTIRGEQEMWVKRERWHKTKVPETKNKVANKRKTFLAFAQGHRIMVSVTVLVINA